MVADVFRDHVETVQRRCALARDGRLGAVAPLGDEGRGVCRRGGGDCGRVGHAREQPAALVEGNRMRMDDADGLDGRSSRADEEVADRQHRLAHDRER